MKIDDKLLRKIIEGALLAAGGPLNIAKIASLFEPPEGVERDADVDPDEKPTKEEILAALEDIQADCKGRGYELKEVGSGWRFQVVQETAPWISRLWEEKPQKYSRALLETLALIAYRQPITRGDIESIRGVAVSSTIIKTLTEREWVKVVGHRDVPGRPALYATTRQFLDYFNLKSLDELPSLKEIQDIDQLDANMSLKEMLGEAAGAEDPADDQSGDEAGAESLQGNSDSGESEAHSSVDEALVDEKLVDEELASEDEEAPEANSDSGSDDYAQDLPPEDFDQSVSDGDDAYPEREANDEYSSEILEDDEERIDERHEFEDSEPESAEADDPNT
ncbi:SMC-Scp complex subunit ScpB [Proteobacteria bacterium 005FR1]|nr:SMC-Scp complex subunit ScpB [Proteobacteria bacterium 005FR1]